jgi:hypothetical protein
MTQGFAAAVCVIVITVGMTLLSIFAGFTASQNPTLNPLVLVDVGFFTLVAIGMRRRLRIAAWSGLAFYLMELCYAWRVTGKPPNIATAVVVLMFVNGVRGAVGYYRIRLAEGLIHRTEPIAVWRWVWPDTRTRAGANLAARLGFWAAVACGWVTLAFALMGASNKAFAGAWHLDAWGLVDAALFAAIAIGMWRRSRVAAWSGLVLYLVECYWRWTTLSLRTAADCAVAATYVLAFVGGVRGAMGWHRLGLNDQGVESVQVP